MKHIIFFFIPVFFACCSNDQAQELKLNVLEYFETQGVNVLVYSNLFTGGL